MTTPTPPTAYTPGEPLRAGVDVGRPIRVGVITNPLSGRNRRGSSMRKLRATAAEYPSVIHHEVNLLSDITAAALDLLNRDVELIVINGGDGTAHAVLTALLRSRPPAALPTLAVLPGGTTNTTAGDVGTREHPTKAVPRLLAEARAGRLEGVVERRAVIRVDVSPQSDPLFGMVFGLGAVYYGVKYYHEKIAANGIRGEIGPGLTVATFVWKVLRGETGTLFPHFQMSGTADGREIRSGLYFGVVLSTLHRIFLGIRPFWGRESGALQFSTLAERPESFLHAIWELVREKPGPYLLNEKCFTSHNVDDLILHVDTGFMLDGELYHSEPGSPLHIRSGCDAPFLRPLK